MTRTPALSPDRILRRATQQTSCDLGDERVLLNVATGVYYGLDPVGSRVWELLEEPRTVASLARTLREEYEVDEETCERDVVSLLERLLAEGLVEVEAPG